MPNSACEQLLAKGRISLEGPTLDPAQILSESGALVISSAYGEAFPIIGTEAAGCGVPVISTDVGSCSDFVDEDKFLVPPQDVPALAQALLDYAELSPAERVQLSQKARKRAEAKYSGQAVADKYFHLFQRLVK